MQEYVVTESFPRKTLSFMKATHRSGKKNTQKLLSTQV